MTASKHQKLETSSQNSQVTVTRVEQPKERVTREDLKEDTELEDETETLHNVTEASV